MKEGEIS